MDIIGLDLHQRESQLCLCDEDGTITERRIVTSRERFTAVLGNRPRTKILTEASTESEWVAQGLESVGHEVVGEEAISQPMDEARSRRTKPDRRDGLRVASCESPLVAQRISALSLSPAL